eukprot:1663795-Pyramimonas_sp.AAC.1
MCIRDSLVTGPGWASGRDAPLLGGWRAAGPRWWARALQAAWRKPRRWNPGRGVAVQWVSGRSSCAPPRPRRPRVAVPPPGWGALRLLTTRRGCPVVRGGVWPLPSGMRGGRACLVPGPLLTGPCPFGAPGTPCSASPRASA